MARKTYCSLQIKINNKWNKSEVKIVIGDISCSKSHVVINVVNLYTKTLFYEILNELVFNLIKLRISTELLFAITKSL